MKVIVWDFKDTGALGVVLGDEAFVDVNYLEEFMQRHPEEEIERRDPRVLHLHK